MYSEKVKLKQAEKLFPVLSAPVEPCSKMDAESKVNDVGALGVLGSHTLVLP